MTPSLASRIEPMHRKVWSSYARGLIAFGLADVAILCAEATCRSPALEPSEAARAQRLVSLLRASMHAVQRNQDRRWRSYLDALSMADVAIRSWGYGGHSNALVFDRALGAVQYALRRHSTMSFHTVWHSAMCAAEEAERLGADLQAAHAHLTTLHELLGEHAG